MIRRNGNPFNSLSASAFFLLMFDPMMIFQVGFQLSYAAVLGILSFYPSIYFLFEFRRQFWDEIWKILAVSIAAQTLTLPMSIFYFHQFPNYFLLANLLIIPLTSLIIYLGIFLLFISPFSFLSIWVGKLIGILIQLTNSIAKGIANLPYSYLENLNWDIFTIIGFYGMVICGVIYFSKRDLLAMQFLLVLVLGLQVQKFYQHNQKSKQHFATIYDVKGGFGLQYGKGGKAIVLQNKSADSLGSTFIKLTQIHQLKLGLEQVQKSTLDSQNYLCELKPGYKLFFIQQNEVPLKEEFEILVVSGNQFIKLEEILANNVVKMVVLNHDMPYKKRLFIKKHLAIHKIPFHDIAEKGAFEVSL
jgi:competence protein ComEC